MIDVCNLTKCYGSHPGVENISFRLNDGEMVGLLGSNGAGKSTIMKMMAGYMMPLSGSIKINGFDMLEDFRKATACIGFMPEICPLYPDMEVGDYLKFAAVIKGVGKKEIKAEVDRVSGLADIRDVQDRLIANLSKGYRQRVGLAQALLKNPEFLILDEPTAGLDPRQITEVRDLLKGIAATHTILISSHILSEIVQTCERVIIIDHGKLVADDTIGNLKKKGRNAGCFILRTSADAEMIRNILKAVPEITDVLKISDADQNEKCSVICTDTDDIRSEAVRLLSENGIEVYEIYRPEISLEQIFLELTKG